MKEYITELIKNNNFNELINLIHDIPKQDIHKYIEDYEKYYERELLITKTVLEITTEFRLKNMRTKIPIRGNYTFKLE